MSTFKRPKKSLKRQLIEAVACLLLGMFIGNVGILSGMHPGAIIAFSLIIGMTFSYLINTLFPVEEKKDENESQGRDPESK